LAVVVVKESTVLAVVKELTVVVVKESTVLAVVKELAVVVVAVVTFVLPLDDLEKPMMMFAVDASQKI